jgi:cell division protease FtsH
VFLGRSVTQHKSVSDDTARRIDAVVRSILDKAFDRTTAILTAYLGKLHTMAQLLLVYETIDAPQVDAIMEGREPPPPMGWTKGGPARDEPKPFVIGGPAAQT